MVVLTERERKLMLIDCRLDVTACCWSVGGRERDKANVT
jgi:hypothetical protein